MATKSAGRVTIRVLPDSSRFREDLRLALDRIEKVTKVTIPATLAVTRESVRELRRQLSELDVRIKVEPYITQEKLHDVRKQIEDLDPQLQVGLNTALARARLTALTRPRVVELIVRVNQASLVAAATTLAALSGARVLSNTFDKFWDAIKNLDKNAPRIGAIATGINSLAGGILALTSNLAGLAGSFVQLSGLAVVLPALLTGAGIAIGTLIAVLKDGKTVLADLGPLFTNLQDSMSSAFWAIAAQPIRDVVHTLMPALKEQLINTSQALGVVTKSLANALGKNLTAEKLNTMFDNLNQAIARSSNAMDPLISAFTTLGLYGSKYLPRLSQWFVDLSEKFNNFITAAAEDGRLDLWAERGIQAFKDLGRVIKEAAHVLGALIRAADAAGGAGFAELADGLARLADTMNSDNFQTTLTTIFRGAHALMDGLIDGLNNLGVGLAAFAPTLESVFTKTGLIIAAFLQNISKILESPSFQRGVTMFFDGFLSFMRSLEPAMPALGQIVGLIGEIAGVMLQAFGPVIADAIILIAPLFTAIWEAVKPLIPTLSTLIRELLPPLADIFMIIATDVLPELVPLIQELAPALVAVVKAIVPYVVEFFRELGNVLRDAQPWFKPVGDGLKFLADVLDGLGGEGPASGGASVSSLIGALATLFANNPGLAGTLTGVGTAFQMFTGIDLSGFALGLGNLISGFQFLALSFQGPAGIIELIGTVIGTFHLLFGELPGFDAFWAGIGAAIDLVKPKLSISPEISGIIAVLRTVFLEQPGWDAFWTTLPTPVMIGLQSVTNSARSGMTTTAITISAGFAGILATWTAQWPTLLPTVTTVFGNIAGSVQGGFPNIIASVLGGMVRILATFDVGWANVVGAVGRWFSQIVGGVGRGIIAVLAESNTLPGRILAGLTNVGGFFAAGASLLGNFAEGVAAGARQAIINVASAIKQITDMLPGSPAKVGPLSGKGWTRIRGQHLVQDMAAGMRDRTEMLKNVSNDIAHAAAPNNLGASFASVQSVAGDANGRALVEIQGDYYGATPERVAADFDKKVRRANLVAQISKVGK